VDRHRAVEASDVDGAYAQASFSCQNVDCHNRKDTTSAYSWYVGATSSCLMCHTAGGGASYVADPTGGLHDPSPAPTISGVAHDEAFGTPSVTCTYCHTYMPAVTSTSTHMTNGSSPANGSANGTGDFYVFTAYSDGNSGCLGGLVNTGCHDGPGETGTWARRWSTTAYLADNSACSNCHGGFNGSDWTFGLGAHVTTDGNVEHYYSWDTDASSEVIGNHNGLVSGPVGDRCDLCHVYRLRRLHQQRKRHRLGDQPGQHLHLPRRRFHRDELPLHRQVQQHQLRLRRRDLPRDGAGGQHVPPGGQPLAVNLLIGPPATCYICHGNTLDQTYWPDQASSPDRAGEHLVHMSRLAAKLNYGAQPADWDDAEQRRCAPTATKSTAAPTGRRTRTASGT